MIDKHKGRIVVLEEAGPEGGLRVGEIEYLERLGQDALDVMTLLRTTANHGRPWGTGALVVENLESWQSAIAHVAP